MTRIRTKLSIALLVISAAVAYLVQSGVRAGWVYSMEADAFLERTEFHDRRVRLSGKVSWENVESNPAMLFAKFDLESNGRSIPVMYRGTVPDMFKPGHDVVLEGRLDAEGTFEADVLLTKCASKYDEASPHAQGESSPYGDVESVPDNQTEVDQ